jgi:pimeloyl-ACP methyl ester carboxylesterase
LIAPNGWSSSPEAVMGMSPPDYQNAFGEKFAQDGYVVFAVFLPTAPGDATRTAAAEAHASFLANMVGEHYWNRMRVEKILSALDFVETLPQADAERIAVYGVSMGGEAGLAAAVLDSRIDALVISGANVLTPRLQMLLELRRFIYPQMYEWNTVALPDVDEMLVGVYPRPVCAEWGRHDRTGDTEAALAVSERVAEVYTRTGAADRFEIVVHDLATTPDGHETEVTACKEFLDRQFQRAADTE